MFKQQHVLPLSLIQLFSGVNLWLARLRGGEGGDLQHYLEIEISSSRAECGFTRGQCHSDLNANCEGAVSSNLKRAKKRRRDLLAYQRCAERREEQQLNLVLQFMAEYLDYQRGGRGLKKSSFPPSFIPF